MYFPRKRGYSEAAYAASFFIFGACPKKVWIIPERFMNTFHLPPLSDGYVWKDFYTNKTYTDTEELYNSSWHYEFTRERIEDSGSQG